MKEEQIPTGEAAKRSGLTIRTLQHYDNIGLLPASGRTNAGRRFYTETDMIRLEHIVFYRRLGFSLEDIRPLLNDQTIYEDFDSVLDKQKTLLYHKIYQMQSSIAAIEASQEIVSAGKNPPWTLLSTFMKSLESVDLTVWQNFAYTAEQQQVFEQDFGSLDEVMEFYLTWKKLSIKSAAFYESGITPQEPIAQKLAKDWIEMVSKVTSGKEEHLDAYLEVDQKRSLWNAAEKELIEKAEPFLNEALAHYVT